MSTSPQAHLGDSSGGPAAELEFSPDGKKHIEWLFTRYPEPEAVLLPALRLAEEEFGNIDGPAVQLVAKTVGVSPGYAFGVLTFYTHYRRAGTGTYCVQVCSTLSCALRGCREISSHFEQKLGIGVGETTPDGKFTLRKVECLGSCDTAPVVQINDKFHENMTPEAIDALLAELGATAPSDQQAPATQRAGEGER